MSYAYSPAQQSALLAQIRQRESGGDYAITNPASTASGAYQMINATWRTAANAVGVDTSQYPTAASAPPQLQDAAAAWLLQTYGPNASITWAASGPYDTGASTAANGSTQPLVDLSGAAAATPTADIMSQIGTWADTAGINLSDPTTDIVIALALGAVAYLALAA